MSMKRKIAAAEMGRSRTEKKAAAARENGKKGGRPNVTAKIIQRCMLDDVPPAEILYYVAKDLYERGYLTDREMKQLKP